MPELSVAHLLSLLVAAFVPQLLEWLKTKPWAPFIAPHAPALNRLTAVGTALLTSIGVLASYDAVTGVLTVTGLQPERLAEALVVAGVNFAVQELVYRQVLRPKPGAQP